MHFEPKAPFVCVNRGRAKLNCRREPLSADSSRDHRATTQVNVRKHKLLFFKNKPLSKRYKSNY